MSPRQTQNLDLLEAAPNILVFDSSNIIEILRKYLCFFTSRQTSRHVDSDLKNLENLQGYKNMQFLQLCICANVHIVNICILIH